LTGLIVSRYARSSQADKKNKLWSEMQKAEDKSVYNHAWSNLGMLGGFLNPAISLKLFLRLWMFSFLIYSLKYHQPFF
jgi:hypothetical protein